MDDCHVIPFLYVGSGTDAQKKWHPVSAHMIATASCGQHLSATMRTMRAPVKLY